MTALLEIRGLRVAFAGATVVDGVDLSLQAGEIHGLVGESGAGKSTVGNAVIGLIEPPGRVTGGEMLLHGRPLQLDAAGRSADRSVVRGRDIGAIFQDPLTSLNPLFTIEQQLCETLRFHRRLGAAAARRRALELLSQVGISEPRQRLRQYPHHFSGGMRQRVVIAMALSCDPQLIIADEPTTALDVSVQAQVLELLKTLCKQRNVGVLLVTHDIGVIAETADRVTVMHRGRVVETGVTRAVLGSPREAYTRQLIAAVPRPDVKLARFPQPGDQRSAKPPAPAPAAAAGAALLEIDRVSVEFDLRRGPLRRRTPFRALDQVSLTVREGEAFGLVGESGSGKSTLANLIVGLLRPRDGAVRFAGTTLSSLDEQALRPYRRQMQMIFQDPYASLNARHRVGDIIAEPLRFHRLAGGKSEQRRQVAALLAEVGLEADAARRYPHAFSGGQRQRISIARALATRPRLLICDEPTSALDVSIQAQILNLLKDLQQNHRLTLLLISHDLPVIRQMCDRVAVLRSGKLCETAATEDLFERPRHDYTRRLLALMPRLDRLTAGPTPGELST